VETVCAFLKAISERSAGTKVTLSVLRSQAKMEVVLPLADTARLFKASCDAGDARGCQSLGAIFTLLGKSPESKKAAAAFYAKACEGGAAVGCSSLGSGYLEGQGVEQDEARALRLFEQACQHGDAEVPGSSAPAEKESGSF
jgi:TPR repeat protein